MSIATPPAFESTEGMSEPCARGLRQLLLACADTKLLLGYHYGEWTFGTPELEAAVASCSLAQGELGHVRLLHALLSKHFGDDPDALMDNRAATDFANVGFLDRTVVDWAGFVAMNYVVDLAVTRVLHSMQGSTFKPIHMSVDKMLDEERYHLHHGRGWFRTLASRGGETKTALERQAELALRSVAEWLGPATDDDDRALVSAGVKRADNQAIYGALCDDVERLAETVGTRVQAPAPTSFSGWTSANRRIGGGGPDEEILFHLRGTKNEVFKLN
ncbi:MAG: phenylacetate-CoA oxygenase subunit PaaI [Gemmatimonadota bacterium]|nr:phenylacetate-CoA oxygenase subunit PaaI [Gemmatimonadota bacterium]